MRKDVATLSALVLFGIAGLPQQANLFRQTNPHNKRRSLRPKPINPRRPLLHS